MIGYDFLAKGAVSPFTDFRWPAPGQWVQVQDDREDAWVRACRGGDPPYWLDDELWRIELEEPVRKARCQVASPGARLVARVAGWNSALGREYARACALRARDLALSHLDPELRDELGALDDLQAIDAVRRAPGLRVGARLAGALARGAARSGRGRMGPRG